MWLVIDENDEVHMETILFGRRNQMRQCRAVSFDFCFWGQKVTNYRCQWADSFLKKEIRDNFVVSMTVL